MSVAIQAASPVFSLSVVAAASHAVGFVSSLVVGCGAGFTAFGKRWVRGEWASSLVPASLPNPAVKRDWPSAALVGVCGTCASSLSWGALWPAPYLQRWASRCYEVYG